jgi:putative transposase
MPRCARTIHPGIAVHVIQRGNNRGRCFFAESDHLAYLRYLEEFSGEAECLVHAYCLMGNHVHLLLTPQSDSSCAVLMKNLSQHYVQYVNRVHGRTGTLWEGRFRSCLATTERYVLACYRYIERNPVRAAMVAHPRDYLWSSYAANALGRGDTLVQPHPVYLNLALDPLQRRTVYADLVELDPDRSTVDEIRAATRNGYTLGAKRKKRGRPVDSRENRDRPHFSHGDK